MLILGTLYSKTNSRIPRQAISKQGKRYIKWIKPPKVQKAFEDMVLQVKALWRQPPILTPAELICWVYYPSRRSDLDVSLLMDILQAGGVVVNDRAFHRIKATKYIDPTNPRIEVTVRSMEGDE